MCNFQEHNNSSKFACLALNLRENGESRQSETPDSDSPQFIEVNLSKLSDNSKFSVMTLFAIIITCAKFHLKLLRE